MRHDPATVKKLKKAATEALKKAEVVNDQDLIDQIKLIDELADDMISRSGKLSDADYKRIFDAFEMVLRILRGFSDFFKDMF